MLQNEWRKEKSNSLPFFLISLARGVRNTGTVLWQPGKQKAKSVPNTTPGWERMLNFGFVSQSHMYLEYIKTVVLDWLCFRRFYIGHRVQETQRCTGIVYCVKLNFNGFMLSAASNSPHTTHCDRHKPCLCILQVNLYLMKSGVLVPCMVLFMVSHGFGHICPCCRLSDLTKLLLPSVRLKYSRVRLDAQPLTNKKCDKQIHQLRTTILKKYFKCI